MTTWIVVSAFLAIVLGLIIYDRLVARFQSTAKLRACLRQSDALYFYNALKELKRRGEDIKEEVVPILNLLVSETEQHRIMGWIILKEIYPELAERVQTFNPRQDINGCKQKLQGIFLSEAQEAAPNH